MSVRKDEIEVIDGIMYGRCPVCGKKIVVDKSVVKGFFDFPTHTFCDLCTKNNYTTPYINALNNGTWQEHGAIMLIEDESLRQMLIDTDCSVDVDSDSGILDVMTAEGACGSIGLIEVVRSYYDNRRNCN